MSFVIWYKVEISEAAPDATGGAGRSGGLGLPLTVSNDAFAGTAVLNADVTVTMSDGAAVDTFEVTMVNLPLATTELLRAVHAASAVDVAIHLGYFDDPSTRTADAGRVLVGRVTVVTSTVGPDGTGRTTLCGQEAAGYALRSTPAKLGRSATTALAVAQELASAAGVPLASGSTLPGSLASYTERAGSVLDALRVLAERADAPMVVRDGKVFLGAAVGAADDPAPTAFDPDLNLVALGNAHAQDTRSQPAPPVRGTVHVTALGHPGLRVGQVAKVTGLSDAPTGELRLSRVVHRLSASGGYVTEVDLIAAGAGRRAQVAAGAQVVVDRWRDTIDRARDDHPAVDMGEVVGYAASGRHVATLRYGQSPEPTEVAPSVASPIDSTVEMHDKPIASPFAFDRTGLMVPVYAKMRALLAHNRGLVNDAVLAGFVWPDNPATRRPANKAGDYWLALPTGLDADGLPQGPGANDLTDASGHRVIQAAGLHVLVGADALPEVGERPDPPDDASITIEHQSGTTITVDPDGAVAIRTKSKAITFSNGSVSLSLDGATVAVK